MLIVSHLLHSFQVLHKKYFKLFYHVLFLNSKSYIELNLLSLLPLWWCTYSWKIHFQSMEEEFCSLNFPCIGAPLPSYHFFLCFHILCTLFTFDLWPYQSVVVIQTHVWMAVHVQSVETIILDVTALKASQACFVKIVSFGSLFSNYWKWLYTIKLDVLDLCWI